MISWKTKNGYLCCLFFYIGQFISHLVLSVVGCCTTVIWSTGLLMNDKY